MTRQALTAAQLIHQGVRFDLCRVSIPGRDGQLHAREVVVHPGAAVVLPLLGQGANQQVIMIRNHRWAVNETLWELPAGTLDGDEPALDAAARELEEETGYCAGRLEPLMEFFSSPGICTEHMAVFVAHDLTSGKPRLEATEEIQVQLLPWEEIRHMLRLGHIRDAKSLVALLYYDAWLRGA